MTSPDDELDQAHSEPSHQNAKLNSEDSDGAGTLGDDGLNPRQSDDELVERVARATAFWHGQKKVVAGETVAARHGYGSWGHSAEQYADAHWREYVEAARAAIAVVLEAQAEWKVDGVQMFSPVVLELFARALNPKER